MITPWKKLYNISKTAEVEILQFQNFLSKHMSKIFF